MKPIIYSLFLLPMTLLISLQMACAEDFHRKGYSEDLYNATHDVTQEQYLKNFMIELFMPHIVKETQKYYKDPSATGLTYDWDNKYNVVEIHYEVEQEINNQHFPYTVTFTANVYNGDMNNQKFFGTDTLTFGVNPALIVNKEIKDHLAIKLIDYKHNKPNND